jgi:2-C-methyl-D-erythritol 4-phosphate cytidylyltransferase
VRSAAAAAIVLAGGSGTRIGVGRNKVYLPLGERTVLGWSLRAFATHPAIGTVVLVTRPEDAEQAEGEVAAFAVPIEVVTGGATRQDSEWCGLHRLAERVAADAIDTVLIHDGARPLVSASLISAVLAAARADGGAVPGLLRDDLAAVTPDGTGLRWPADDALVAVQTPQGFRAGPLLAAYDRARREGFAGTDTASCVQRFTDLSVRWVPGDERNLKITYLHDLARAERLVSPVTR